MLMLKKDTELCNGLESQHIHILRGLIQLLFSINIE